MRAQILSICLLLALAAISDAVDIGPGEVFTLPARIQGFLDIGPYPIVVTPPGGVEVLPEADLTVRTSQAVFTTGTRVAAGAKVQIKLVTYYLAPVQGTGPAGDAQLVPPAANG